MKYKRLERLLTKIKKTSEEKGTIASIMVIPKFVEDISAGVGTQLPTDSCPLSFVIWLKDVPDHGVILGDFYVDLYEVSKEDMLMLDEYTADLSFHQLIEKFWKVFGDNGKSEEVF